MRANGSSCEQARFFLKESNKRPFMIMMHKKVIKKKRKK